MWDSLDSKLSPEYRKALADMYTSQLVSHGAMLFASLIASVSFLDMVVGRPVTVTGSWGCLVSWLFLGCLLGFTSYVVSRVLWFAILLTIVYEPLPTPGQRAWEYGMYFDLNIDDPYWEYSQLVGVKAYCRCGFRNFKRCDERICYRLEGMKEEAHVHEDAPLLQQVRGFYLQPRSAFKRFVVHLSLGLVSSSWLLRSLLNTSVQAHGVLSTILALELFSGIAVIVGALVGYLSGLLNL